MVDAEIPGRLGSAWLLAALSLFLLAVCADPARGLQPASPPEALTQSLEQAFELIGDRKVRDARSELERAQSLAAGPCGECLLGMSHVYAAEKDWKRSQETARQALPLLKAPGLVARAYNQIGTASFQAKDLDGAEDAFRHAANSGGAWGLLARYNLAQLLLTRGHWADAVDSARAYLADAGPDGAALDRARTVLCQARSRLPEDPPRAEGSSSPEIQRVGAEVSRPELVFQTPPSYTEAARRAQTRGRVVLEAIIDEEGCVRRARALEGLPEGLTESALSAVRSWVFRPAMMAGKPVKIYYVLTVNFDVQTRLPPVR